MYFEQNKLKYSTPFHIDELTYAALMNTSTKCILYTYIQLLSAYKSQKLGLHANITGI